MGKIIGIDLGTTNSCVAVFEPDGPRVLLSKTGQNVTPSVVAVTDQGKRLVGHLAKRQAITNPSNTVSGAKRLIGRRWEAQDVGKARDLVSYELVQGPHEDVRMVMGGKVYAVPEISSIVLHEMRLVAERALGEQVEQAVITVPAYFSDNQRQATKDAGAIAGLDVVRIINEPTAAALAYSHGRQLSQRVLVYDLGGGTFDVSILELDEGVCEVLATAGDTFLGGEDFDERIIDWLLERFQAQHGVDLRHDKMALQRMRDAAEKAKIELSASTEAEINLPFIVAEGKETNLHLKEVLSRDQLNSLVADLVDRTLEICRRALDRAKTGPQDIKAALLVGGMTRMPLVRERLKELTGKPPSGSVHPDEVVACGAAIQGAMLEAGRSGTLLLDVTPHDLGIMLAGGVFDVLIEKDTTIPTSMTKTFTTTHDGQDQVRVVVLQGESLKAEGNELLGEFVLDGLRSAPRGEVQVDVTFSISADGIVGVSAKDRETSKEQRVTLRASSGLTPDEIKQMIAENRTAEIAAAASDALQETALQVDRGARELEKILDMGRGQLMGSDDGRDAVAKAEGALEQARRALVTKDLNTLTQVQGLLERTVPFVRELSQPRP